MSGYLFDKSEENLEILRSSLRRANTDECVYDVRQSVIQTPEVSLLSNTEDTDYRDELPSDITVKEDVHVLEIVESSFGVEEVITVDSSFAELPEVRSIQRLHSKLAKMFREPALLELGGGKDTSYVDGPILLSEKVLEFGRKGLTINRYKGLGEMNADQLWETTLDPASRSLLQVRLTQEFIQSNAEKVVNLDV